LIRVKPHWSAPLLASVLGLAWCGILIWRSYVDHWGGGQTYWFVAIAIAWLCVCGYFAFYHVLEISHDTLVLHRYLGLGDRRIPISDVLEVVLVPASNWLGMPIPSVRIEWDTGRVSLHSSAYSVAGLEQVVSRLAESGVRFRPSVLDCIASRKGKPIIGPPWRRP